MEEEEPLKEKPRLSRLGTVLDAKETEVKLAAEKKKEKIVE